MPVRTCPHSTCNWQTDDVDDVLAAEFFAIHRAEKHTVPVTPAQTTAATPTPATAAAATRSRRKAPLLDHPKISTGSSEEVWNAWKTRWDMFKRGADFTADELLQHLFQCCGEALGDAILRGYPSATTGSEQDLLDVIKKLAVIKSARVVRRMDLLSLRQDHGESVRSYLARITGKAATCGYNKTCSNPACTTQNDFTEIIIKDVLVHGLVDDEIKKEVVGWAEVDTKNVEETTSFVEAKEMARDAMSQPSQQPLAAAPVTDRGLPARHPPPPSAQRVTDKKQQKTNCTDCGVQIDKYFWHHKRRKQIACSKCKDCWQKDNSKSTKQGVSAVADETAALLIGALSAEEQLSDSEEAAPSEEVVPPSAGLSEEIVSSSTMPTPAPLEEIAVTSTCDPPSETVTSASGLSEEIAVSTSGPTPVVLDHHIFDYKNGWRRSESMAHPSLRLRLSTERGDYDHLGALFPDVMPSYVSVVTDTGAQACLWSLAQFYRAGFQDSDLIPVKRTMCAANREQIEIVGAIIIRLSAKDNLGNVHTAVVMAYVSPSTNKFYLSREALIQLGVISKDFPRVGSFIESCPIQMNVADCGCQIRSLPPSRPANLPFRCCSENNDAMRMWLLDRYSQSTFNKCPHQKLDSITGPELRFHMKPSASFKVVHTPAMVALHDQEEVKAQLDADVALGVLEKVPYNEPSVCCHRMHIVRKADGSPRRVVDMSSLNDHLLRETHHVKPPFQQAKSIPRDTWKSVTDAWNGYHSVPLREEDRYLTTFITPWGRYRYRVAPQGSAVSGDAYNRRYDEVIVDVERKTKCVDDTAHWDDSLEDHWWRMIDFLELTGKNGVVLNGDKFQFAQREVDFAGFRVTETSIKPLEKYLRAILDFPTPKKTGDIRAWFGLVNHVSHYNRLINLVSPFRVFLGKNKKFEWNDELEAAFQKSKLAIVDAIREGVEIFDVNRPTLLQTDYSETGIGYFLSQKHCSCPGISPGCCQKGWRITLAGSRFLKPAESRYSPIEGEALAIAWSLEQTKYFTLGCPNLTITTDHKPLLGLLGSCNMDQITNPRLFSLKQRTLLWSFKIVHLPGRDNKCPDAASRFPSTYNDDDDDLQASQRVALSAIRMHDSVCDAFDDEDLCVSTLGSSKEVRAVTWDCVREETRKDPVMQKLVFFANSMFPSDKSELPDELIPYWPIRDSIYVVDDVVLMKDRIVLPRSLQNDAMITGLPGMDRIVIPPSLRGEIISTLHAAHQGVSCMNERAKAGVYWPGITTDILKARQSCASCNRNMPSQSRLPPAEAHIPTAPFEAIACDYFHFKGWYYLVAADRLSGWVELSKVKVGTNESGAPGLCIALRRLMITFGVPVEIASDGGPEFISGETKSFFKRWGIRHRLSSVAHPSSNGRAELAVKSAKRLLEDNIGPDGELNNDNMVRALLTLRNTPDPGCKLSPAQIVLGRQLRDSMPYLNKDVMVYNNSQIQPHWREAWKLKEEALRTRYVKTVENLSEHARALAPLRHGDHVMVQNQRGRHPKKWDNSGVVVETKPHDQYVVKISGSGRLTLRNRRFLRLYRQHDLVDSIPPIAQPTHDHDPSLELRPQHSSSPHVTSPQAFVDRSAEHPTTQIDHTPVPPMRRSTPTRLRFGDFSPEIPASEAVQDASAHAEVPLPAEDFNQPPAVILSERRSGRLKKQRTVYDADAGTYKNPSSVPETL